MYTASDLRNMKEGDLHKEARNLSKDLYLLRVESANGQLKQHHKIKKLKRTISRIHTVIAERKRAAKAEQSTKKQAKLDQEAK